MKPQISIGSPVERLHIAGALQSNLEHEIDSAIWCQGVFGLADTTLQLAMRQAERADFATFVLSPDDVTQLRGHEVSASRDSAVLEFGLFAGALGARRGGVPLKPRHSGALEAPRLSVRPQC